MNPTNCCIIGAGPAGATAALHLAKAGIPCVLLDKAVFPRDKICGDALSAKVMKELERIDASLGLRLGQEPSARGSRGIVFGAPGGQQVRVPFGDAAQGAPGGYLMRRFDFDDFLIRAVRQQPLIDLREGEEVQQTQHSSAGWRVTTSSGAAFGARLLLVANGAQSVFSRQTAGLIKEPDHYSAGLRAYYAGVRDLDPDGYIELHFLKPLLPGYLWIFPLVEGYANVGVGLLNSVIARKKINLKNELLNLIQTHPVLKERFAGAQRVGDIKGFGLPLGSRRRILSGNQYLLLGDAAHLIDPFTGEGISNAMISGRWAAEWARRGLAANDLSGHFLSQYDRAVYNRLGQEFRISRQMQHLSRYPALFDFVVRKASRNPSLQQLLSSMFVDLDLRSALKQPSFYAKLLFR